LRTEVENHFLPSHADAVVVDCQGPVFHIGLDPDLSDMVIRDDFGVGHLLEAKPVKRVGCVGDQLPEEDVLGRIEGIDHQVEQPRGFGLEFKGFGRRGHGASKWNRPR